MITLHELDSTLQFPRPEQALMDPNGLLAFGGDLSVNRLVNAYQNGIFPWFSENEPILWWSPDPRGIIFVEQYQSTKSLTKFVRKTQWQVWVNRDFNQVINHCASVNRKDNGTWISPQMIRAYQQLHLQGYAHSFEVWDHDRLVGGLYGVFVNHVFCGESMFSLQSNASKVAFHFLADFLKAHRVVLIDCQMQNPHLATLGCKTIERSQFLSLLKQSRDSEILNIDWSTQRIR